jgi:hypothetical protein
MAPLHDKKLFGWFMDVLNNMALFIIKPTTIGVILSIATSNDWPIHQLSMKNVFLHGFVENVYAEQPLGFVSSLHPWYVCESHMSLYGLKQSPQT